MLSLIPVIAGTLVVTAVEKIPAIAHAHTKEQIGVGLVFALPFLVAALLLEKHKNAGKKPAQKPAQRPSGYPFGNSPR